MKVFVTGVAGQLGHDVINELMKRNDTGQGVYECVGSDLAPVYSGDADETAVTKTPYMSLDITDSDAVDRVITEVNPDAIVHCAAWTAVDAAEDDDKKELVRNVNVVGTENIAKIAKKLDCKMMYISTDYVFDGQGETPWDPDCKDYAPLNVYGQSKLAGELAVSEIVPKYFVVRTAWVFGKNGNNFIKTMLKVGKKNDSLSVVCDQIGTPTYTIDLAVLLCDMICTDKYGYYHATNSELAGEGYTDEGCKCGYISWYDFTKEIFRLAVEIGHSEYGEENVMVAPVTTAEYGASKAARPFNSRLDKTKLTQNGFALLPTWQDAVKRYIAELDFKEIK